MEWRNMYRERENRIFGKPASLECNEKEIQTRFVITMNPEDIQKDVNKAESKSVEVQLVQFANSTYAKELAQNNDCDTFIQYCLENIYHTNLEEILKRSTRIVDGQWKVESDYLLYMEVALAAGLIVAAEIGALAVTIVMGDEPGEEPGTSNISSAAVVCGGKEFGERVVNRYCELLQMEAEKRCGKNA